MVVVWWWEEGRRRWWWWWCVWGRSGVVRSAPRWTWSASQWCKAAAVCAMELQKRSLPDAECACGGVMRGRKGGGGGGVGFLLGCVACPRCLPSLLLCGAACLFLRVHSTLILWLRLRTQATGSFLWTSKNVSIHAMGTDIITVAVLLRPLEMLFCLTSPDWQYSNSHKLEAHSRSQFSVCNRDPRGKANIMFLHVD